MGEDELNDRRQLVRASGLAVGQRSAAVSALRRHDNHHGTMSAPPVLGAACAHSVRHHSHLIADPYCAGIRSLSSETHSRRLNHITERTRGRLLAARRPRSSPTASPASRQPPLAASTTSSCVLLSTGCAAPTVCTDPAHFPRQLASSAFRFPILWPHPAAMLHPHVRRPDPYFDGCW